MNSPAQPPQEERAKGKQHMAKEPRARSATAVIFLPTLLYMALFFLYAVSIWDFYHGFMGLALLTFLPCFFGCFFILPVVGLAQFVFGIYSLFIKNDEGPQHILSALATLLLTACFFLFLMAGNVVTV